MRYNQTYSKISNTHRSSKKRSYRIKDDLVVDYQTNKKCSFKEFSKGHIEILS